MESNSYALNYLAEVKIKEIIESSEAIIIIFELIFKDGNVSNYQYRILKDEIQVGNINAMVL